MMEVAPNRIRSAYETAKSALLAELVSEPVAADDPVQKQLDAPVSEMRHWVGELSNSALSTATAVMALEQMRRQYVSAGRELPESWTRLIRGGIEWLIAHQNEDGGWGDTVKSVSNISTTMLCHAVLHATDQASGGRQPPGSAGSLDVADQLAQPTGGLTPPARLNAARGYIDRAGGVPAVIARYGKDRTFSVPILTHCALAGLVDWDEVISLPFELACIPARFYAAVRLPVVSYALPALIAIGQVRFHFRPSWNPLRRWLQRWAKPASLRVLERIQPPNGGFLEATPLTSFVTMSLAAMGLIDHPVTRRGIEFIVASARWENKPVGWVESSRPTTDAVSMAQAPPDSGSRASTHPPCSWPIDTNLATWVTTLSINALGDDVPLDARPGLRAWLLRQQYRVVHPYTNAAPGGWAWTDLPGGVPDGDDTPGAMLALIQLQPAPRSSGSDAGQTANSQPVGTEYSVLSTQYPDRHALPDGPGVPPGHDSTSVRTREISEVAVRSGERWLLGLQNRDGGWPTFCRGWGALPFDRSSPDITAHVIRALAIRHRITPQISSLSPNRLMAPAAFAAAALDDPSIDASLVQPLLERNLAVLKVTAAVRFLEKAQRPDGSWLPLWFGNQHAPNDENPTYGTAKVLAAFQALGRMSDESAVRGVRWLVENQNPDGGWGAGLGTPSSIEETALALEALLGCDHLVPTLRVGTPAQTRRVTNSITPTDAERPKVCSHAERGNELVLAIQRGLSWLIPRVEDGRFREPSPIGFYFAKLWYFEALYPLIFTVAALRKAAAVCENEQ